MGVVDTIKMIYAVDVEDRGTHKLVASQRTVGRETKRTSAVLAHQDTQMRRHGASAAHSSARAAAGVARVSRARRASVTEIERETRALRANATASARAGAAARRGGVGGQGLVRRGAANAAGSARGAAGAVAGLVSIAAGRQAVNVTLELAKTTIALNKNLGLGVEQASRWAAVARSRNIDSKALNMSFGALSRNVGAANAAVDKQRVKLAGLGTSQRDQEKRQALLAKGAGAQVEAFKKLGISQDELKDGDFDATLRRAADGLAALPAGAERTALSMKLFGRGWQTVVPILRGGSRAMDEQLKLADKYGVTFKGKTVKSLQELVLAQREAKFASMGLQVAFGTQVAPALTKAINAGSRFAAQMRSGEGAGGRFAKQAREIASDLRPVGRVLKTVGGFLAAHPRLVVAAAGAYVAFKAARGTMRIVGDLRAMRGAILATRNAAASTRIATLLASGAAGTGRLVGRALRGVGSVVSRVMRGAGTQGGEALGRSAATGASTTFGPGIDARRGRFIGGRWARMGRLAGRAFGVAAALMLAEEIGRGVEKALGDARGAFGEGGRNMPGMPKIPTDRLGDWLGGKLGLGGRRGGVVTTAGMVARRFQHGGLVPILASGGEMLVDGQHAAMIPGPSGRDATPMMVRPGSAILTGDGQARMSMGASLAEAVATQAPHFAKGGIVQAARSLRGAGFNGSQLVTGVAVAGPESGYRNEARLVTALEDSRSMWQINTKAHHWARTLNLLNPDVAAGAARRVWEQAGKSWRPWTGYTSGAYRGYLDRARKAVTSTRGGTRAPAALWATGTGTGGARAPREPVIAAASRRRQGLIADAFEQGQQAGQAGLTRSRTRLEGNPIIAAIRDLQPDKGTRMSVSDVARATGPAASKAGASPRATSRLGRMRSLAGAIDGRRYQYAWGGGHGRIGRPSTGTRHAYNRGKAGLGYDCSGGVSAVLWAGGLLKAPLTSGGLMSWGRQGSGKGLAVHADAGHTIMRIGSRYWGTGEQNPGGGAGWLTSNTMGGRGVTRTWPGMRVGGIAGRSRLPGLRIPTGAQAPVPVGKALTGGVSRAMSMVSGSLEALDEIIGRSADARIGALRRQIERGVQKGGPTKVVDRLRAVLSVIDFELGRRVGRAQDVVAQRSRAMDRSRGVVDRRLREAGTAAESSQGIGVMQTLQARETTVRTQNVGTLGQALRRAQAAGNRTAVAEIKQQLEDARDELDESFTRQIELRRDAVRALGQERVGAAQFLLGLTQTGGGLLDAHQRLTRTQDTPDGMRQRAGYQQGVVIPALEAARQAAEFNAGVLRSIGDMDGWRSAVQDAASAAVDLASAQADAADLLREAAARAAQDQVDAVTHRSTMADLGLQRLEVQQRLAGTFESTGAAQSRADYIRQQIVPAIDQEILALTAQQMAAQAAGDVALARQIAEAIFAKGTSIEQAKLDALEAIKTNTDLLKEFGGSAAFSYRDQVQTDLDVLRARAGA